MNPFNDVLQAIKKHCRDTDIINNAECFEMVALESNISLNRLYLYLNILQDLNLIKYSEVESFIQLTEQGRQKETLFASA